MTDCQEEPGGVVGIDGNEVRLDDEEWVRVKGDVKVVINRHVDETKPIPLSGCQGYSVVRPGSLSNVLHGSIDESITGLRWASSVSCNAFEAVDDLKVSIALW